MRQELADFLRRLLQGSRWKPEEVLWAVLICSFLLSTLHLTTMFLTRWGNRRVTGKALLCSLLLHLAVAATVFTVAPPPSVPQGGGEDEEEHRVLIRSVSTEGAREPSQSKQEASQSGTPIWDRVPSAKEIKPTGPVPVQPQTAPKDVARLGEKVKPPELKAPELASLPENHQPAPTASAPFEPSSPDATTAKQTARTPEIEVPKSAALARPKSSVPAPSMPNPSPLAATDSKVPRQAPGSLPGPRASRTIPTVNLPTDLPAVRQAPTPKASVAENSAEESKSRQSGPAPTAPVPTEPSSSKGPPRRTGSSGSVVRGPTMPAGPESRWQASINRLPSGSLGSNPSPPSTTGEVGNYQPLDTRPPAPNVSGTSPEPLIVRRSAGVPLTYRLRKLSNRKENARAFGGTDQSERAVESSLRWLATVQNRDGYWDAKAFGAGQVKVDDSGIDRDYAGRDADSGVTALAILAFLGAGYTHEEGQYSENLDRALRWLISRQQPDGNLGLGAGHFAMMYCHGIATYAIAEAYGMQNDPTSNTMLREPLVRAVQYILDNQNPDGGWRYVKGQKSDISMTGWQLMALKSAEIAGVNVPRDAKVKMVAFLKDRSLGSNGGLAGYRESAPPTASMTAEALFCKQMLGIKRDNAASMEAADYLLARLPKRSDYNEYYWYYGTLAMYHFGGSGWQSWNGVVRELLVSEQRTTGEFSGSWDPTGPWAKYGGRIYSTALSTLCLEVYYRFLPLYQLGTEKPDGKNDE